MHDRFKFCEATDWTHVHWKWISGFLFYLVIYLLMAFSFFVCLANDATFKMHVKFSMYLKLELMFFFFDEEGSCIEIIKRLFFP